MATISARRTSPTPSAGSRHDEFVIETTTAAPDLNLPQRMAERLWAPMLAMGLMGLVVGLVLALIRADGVSSGVAADTLAQLQHVQTGVTFIGFAGVFSGIVFAIARILGVFRTGGGRMQEAVGGDVQTLRMPATAKAMIGLMAIGMMAIVGAVVLHFVVAASVIGPSEAELLRSEQWFVTLEGVRRVGVSSYLLSITFGLATIIHVLRFQSVRLRELVGGVG